MLWTDERHDGKRLVDQVADDNLSNGKAIFLLEVAQTLEAIAVFLVIEKNSDPSVRRKFVERVLFEAAKVAARLPQVGNAERPCSMCHWTNDSSMNAQVGSAWKHRAPRGSTYSDSPQSPRRRDAPPPDGLPPPGIASNSKIQRV